MRPSLSNWMSVTRQCWVGDLVADPGFGSLVDIWRDDAFRREAFGEAFFFMLRSIDLASATGQRRLRKIWLRTNRCLVQRCLRRPDPTPWA